MRSAVVRVVYVGALAVVVVGFAHSVVVVLALTAAVAAAFAASARSRAAAERFTQLFDANPIAQSLSDLDDGRVIAVNPAYERLFGIRREAIIGRTPLEAGIRIAPGARERLLAVLRETEELHDVDVAAAGPAGEKELVLSSRVVDLDGVRAVVSSFVDVTDRHRLEREASAADERMREILEYSDQVFWLTNADNTKILYVSPSYEKVFGRTTAGLYADSHDWLAALHPDERERMHEFAVAAAEASRDERYRVVLPTGELRTVAIHVTPIRDASGTVVRYAGIAQDISARIELEEQVRQTQKLESVGLLAGGIAHDFNNVLAVISANIELLGDDGDPGLQRELIDEIRTAVARGTSLTRQLLAFSRKQVVEPVVLDVNAAIKDTRKMLRRMVGEDVVIATSLDADLPPIKIDPGYLVQVLMNLAVNARDAMPAGGDLTLATRHDTDRGEVLITVSDTGCGMDPATRARVFEPFFTTKAVGKGTGLGLSVVHGIVEQAGGRIEVKSAVGVGTSFLIYLPASDQPIEPIADVSRLAPVGTERILLVDDDPFVRRASARALRARGYAVLEASGGDEALARIGEHPDIRMLVTDVVMPGMDGARLAALARASRPDLRVLFTSGYIDDALIQHGVQTGGDSFLEKPFGSHELAGRVRALLDAA